jgi:aspartyl/asparaginyl beta-hydroxylase (cupin superfamily)
MKKLKLDYHIFKGLVNSFLNCFTGGRKRPVFFDITRTYPALNELTRNVAAIRAEAQEVLATQSLPEYHDVDPGERAISQTTPATWNVFMLDILGHKPEGNRALCPDTARLLDGIPGLVQAFFSVLAPGKSIPEHEGPYYGYLRYHLALEVPRQDPPCILVNGRKHVWKEGEAVMFDDSWPHEVVNHSTERRVVLIVDVLRPMPWVPSLLNRFITSVIARNTYGKKVAQRVQKYAPMFD